MLGRNVALFYFSVESGCPSVAHNREKKCRRGFYFNIFTVITIISSLNYDTHTISHTIRILHKLHARFTFYYSDSEQVSNSNFDCIFGYLNDNLRDDLREKTELMIHSYHLIPYCRRPDTDEIQEEIGSLDKNYNQIISFNELKKQGVTSTQFTYMDGSY